MTNLISAIKILTFFVIGQYRPITVEETEMGIVERAKSEGESIKRWYRKNVMPYDYKVLKRNDNGTAVGPA
ncbi:MAG: hypothetical protein AAB820_02355, partial [Patescibacteria group bacterium]